MINQYKIKNYRITRIAVSMLLAGLMLLSACGKGAESDEGRGAEQTDVKESSAGESSESRTEQTVPPEKGSGLPAVRTERLSAVRYTEDGETELAYIMEDAMTLSGEGYESAAEAVERLLGRTQANVDEEADAYAEMALEHYLSDQESGSGYFSAYCSYDEYEVTRLDTRILSVKRSTYDYSGGIHGYGAEWGTTVDLENGLELELPHMMEDVMGFWAKAEEVILSRLAKREEDLYEDYKAAVSEELEETDWYLDAGGIEFCFTPYAIGPYASGTITVCVPYEEVAEYMKPEYLEAQETAGVIRIPRDENVKYTPTAGGAPLEIRFESRPVGEYDDVELYAVINDRETLLGENIWFKSAYLFRRPEGRAFLVYDFDWASDDFETVVYEVTDGSLTETDRIGASIGGGSVGPDRLGLVYSIQVLGSHSSYVEHSLTQDGKLEPLEERYEIAYLGESRGLTLVKDLPVEVNGKSTVVPAGSKISVVATDNDGTVWFETVDGSMSGIIRYERKEDDYQLFIDGVSEYEYFETLPYAG